MIQPPTKENTNLIPKITFEDIGGATRAKELVLMMTSWCVTNSEKVSNWGLTSPSGAILYGPPGTGKTLLAKAAANSCHCRFYSIAIPDLLRCEVGESEKRLTRVFECARADSPSIVFIDEIQALFGRRNERRADSNRLVVHLIAQLDLNAKHGAVFCLAATNALEAVDPALLQPGRFEEIIEISYPSKEDRKSVFGIAMKEIKHENNVEDNLEMLADMTDGFTASDITGVCQKAAITALMNGKEMVCFDDVRNEIQNTPLIQFRVRVSQLIKITGANQPLGPYMLSFMPTSNGISFTLQNSGGPALVSFLIKPSFSFSLDENNNWNITNQNKQWKLEFINEKERIKAEAVLGFLLSFKNQNSISTFDVKLNNEDEKIQINDKVEMNCYGFSFSDFPYIDKLSINRESFSSYITPQNLGNSLSNGICGMTHGSTRIIYVPEQLYDSDKLLPNPDGPIVFHITLVHVKYNRSSSGDSPKSAKPVKPPVEDPKPIIENDNKQEKIDKLKKVGALPSAMAVPNKPANNEKPKDPEPPHVTIETPKPTPTPATSSSTSASASQSNQDLSRRISSLEQTIDSIFNKVNVNRTVNSNEVIKEITNYSARLQKQQAELDSLHKQLQEQKAKQSGNNVAKQQQDKAKQFLDTVTRKKTQIDAELKDSEFELRLLEKSAVENSDKVKAKAKDYVKMLMNAVFDGMNETFDENKKYSGDEVSKQLFNLLRKHSFEVMDEIDSNSFF
ncbi:ATPase, AAA family protein [Histomonas meleagridis]|uniref:ATPase, AAA family protein n=1 Tax=Histomonas meleagridis TaxID=135588 RepID=UPI00355A4DDB|nr:ATPase, AAA family protein [Histomonas meleagridis]KAH0797512.1 ATPase, AAA family protein [Histomonas meleagridis]